MTITDTHTADISIADMLNELPNAFGIEDIESAFAVPEREAVFIADYIEQENGSVLGGDCKWIRLPTDEDSYEISSCYHKIGSASDMDRLEAFYGHHPRRIEGLKALEYSGVALMSTLSAASTKQEDTDYARTKFKILHRHENLETLSMHSKKINNKTWVSSIERCLLELADEMSCTTILEYLMIAIEDEEYSCEKIISASIDLDYSIALRKIGSIVKWIPDNHCLPNAAHEIAKIASDIPGGWENISDIIRKNRDPVIEDEEFRIIWRIDPEKVYANTLT